MRTHRLHTGIRGVRGQIETDRGDMTWEAGHDRWKGQNRPGPTWFDLTVLRSPSATRQSHSTLARPNTNSGRFEIHGFVPLPHGRFTFVVCNRFCKERAVCYTAANFIKRIAVFFVKTFYFWLCSLGKKRALPGATNLSVDCSLT